MIVLKVAIVISTILELQAPLFAHDGTVSQPLQCNQCRKWIILKGIGLRKRMVYWNRKGGYRGTSFTFPNLEELMQQSAFHAAPNLVEKWCAFTMGLNFETLVISHGTFVLQWILLFPAQEISRLGSHWRTADKYEYFIVVSPCNQSIVVNVDERYPMKPLKWRYHAYMQISLTNEWMQCQLQKLNSSILPLVCITWSSTLEIRTKVLKHLIFCMEVGNFTLPYTSVLVVLLFQSQDKKTFPDLSLNNAEYQGVFHVGGNIGQRSFKLPASTTATAHWKATTGMLAPASQKFLEHNLAKSSKRKVTHATTSSLIFAS